MPEACFEERRRRLGEDGGDDISIELPKVKIHVAGIVDIVDPDPDGHECRSWVYDVHEGVVAVSEVLLGLVHQRHSVRVMLW